MAGGSYRRGSAIAKGFAKENKLGLSSFSDDYRGWRIGLVGWEAVKLAE